MIIFTATMAIYITLYNPSSGNGQQHHFTTRRQRRSRRRFQFGSERRENDENEQEPIRRHGDTHLIAGPRATMKRRAHKDYEDSSTTSATVKRGRYSFASLLRLASSRSSCATIHIEVHPVVKVVAASRDRRSEVGLSRVHGERTFISFHCPGLLQEFCLKNGSAHNCLRSQDVVGECYMKYCLARA